MEEIRNILEPFEDREVDYIMQRMQTTNDKAAYSTVGISRGSWYNIPEERRIAMNEAAQKIKRERAAIAMMNLQDVVAEASGVIIETMQSDDRRNKKMKFDAATQILDRVLGKPTQRTQNDNNNSGEMTINVKYEDEQDN